jgi:hypothetical protein
MTIDTLSHKSAIDKCEELAALVDRYTNNQGNGVHATAIDCLFFMRECHPVAAMHVVSEPLLAIVIQGQKELWLNEESFR